MIREYSIPNTYKSACSLIFFEKIFRFFQRKTLSTFSTLSTKLIFSKIIYIFNYLQSSTIFYKTPILTIFSTFFYDFYTLIENTALQITDNVHCRKLKACRKCRTQKCVCRKQNFFGQKQVNPKSNHLNTFAK